MTYDVDGNSFYLRLAEMKPGSVGRNALCFENSDEIILDFDGEGKLVGIEVQNASKNIPIEILEQCERVGIDPNRQKP